MQQVEFKTTQISFLNQKIHLIYRKWDLGTKKRRGTFGLPGW